VIPRSDPNKNAVNEEARTVITIGHAVVRIVVVVAVGADRFCSNVGVSARVIVGVAVGVIVIRTYFDAHRNLCRRTSYGKEKEQGSQQRNLFQISHGVLDSDPEIVFFTEVGGESSRQFSPGRPIIRAETPKCLQSCDYFLEFRGGGWYCTSTTEFQSLVLHRTKPVKAPRICKGQEGHRYVASLRRCVGWCGLGATCLDCYIP